MLFSATVAAALVLVPAASAAVIRDAHKLDFRSFGVSGCHDGNQGVWTLTASQADQCTPFSEAVGSIIVTDSLCNLTLYTNDNCSAGVRLAPTSVCEDGDWKSFKMIC